ncbi:MAG TPA: response regulator, partial [Armatimonadota bacterium]|nr:response regulator [Armatimonadota bacterium]
VVTDFSMPDISGVELAQRIKKSAPQMPILLITGWDFQLDEDPAVRAVTDAVLQKPVGHDELLGTLARIAHHEDKTEPAPATTTAATRILVVEDEPAVARVVQEVLTDAGYAVECNNTAEKALECFMREKPQLLITDLHLDGMTGTALACKVKEQSAAIPVILLTGWQSAEEDLHAVDYVLEKPFNVTDLLELVTLAVGPNAPGGNG